MSLDDALNQFDAVETTLRRLEDVQQRLAQLVPVGIAFYGDSPEGIEYENLCRAFRELVAGLPPIGGWTISEFPLPLDGIAQDRLDAQEIGEIEAKLSVEQAVAAPGEAIREYRFRFSRLRRSLVRQRVQELLDEIPTLLAKLMIRIERDSTPIDDPDWSVVVEVIREVERLLGSTITRRGRWGYLHRHLAWAQGCDLHDIVEHDWPSVLDDIRAGLYDEFEPIPVHVDDLVDLVAAHPTGKVSTQLAWSSLNDEAFERLVFNLISDAHGYENPQWLMRTNAPDRGRDLSVDRVVSDTLSGVMRQRCRHWQTKSIAPADVTQAVTIVKLWEPPPIDIVIIATSGRFTSDAVALIERRNQERQIPLVEMWPESHLESLLAQRPHLVSQFGLRRGEARNQPPEFA